MKKTILFLGLLTLILSVACKKSKVEESISSENEITGVLDSNNVSGILIVTDTVLIDQNTILLPIDTIVQARFYDINNQHEPTLVNAVSVNGAPVSFYSPHGYQSSLKGKNIIPATWDIKGSNIIPDFTYTNLKDMPEYLKYKELPSIIDRSKDWIIPLSGFKNTRYVTILIDDHMAYGIMLAGPAGDSKSFTFPSNSLSQLTPNSRTSIEVRIENINYQLLGGKTFGFINEIILKKNITLQ